LLLLSLLANAAKPARLIVCGSRRSAQRNRVRKLSLIGDVLTYAEILPDRSKP